MQKELGRCVDPRTGQIQVNEYCQVTQKHPLLESSDIVSTNKIKTYGNIFAFGDVCITPSNEQKTIVSIHQYKKIIANNVVKKLKGYQDPEEWQRIPESFCEITNIPLGTKMGLVVINDQLILNAGNIK